MTGTSPTTIRTKVWRAGTTEPAGWQIITSDSTAQLQAAGAVGLNSYISSAANNTPILTRYDNLNVTPAN